jgi:hypothetical protein
MQEVRDVGAVAGTMNALGERALAFFLFCSLEG